MVRLSLFLACLLGSILTTAQSLHVGLKIQKTRGMYWENGISAQYSFKEFYPDQFHVGLDYFSSRFGSAFHSNALKQDNVVATAAWYFRKKKSFRILTKLNVGIFKVNLEEEIFDELPNSAFILSPEVGLSYRYRETPFMVNLGAGYNLNLQEEGESPGTYQPLFYNLSLFYNLLRK